MKRMNKTLNLCQLFGRGLIELCRHLYYNKYKILIYNLGL